MISNLKRRLSKFVSKPPPSAGNKDETIAAYSFHPVILGYLNLLGLERGCAVDIAALDGVTGSTTYDLYKMGWGGLAVEYDAKGFSQLARNYVNFQEVNLAKCMVTPINVLALLETNGIPRNFDFLSLDIDGYDHEVLEQVLTGYRPKLICAEINEKIPPPIMFTVKWRPDYVWNADHFYGQSLSQLHHLAGQNGYSLVELHYNNAFLIPSELNIKPALRPEQAYREGYLEKPDRKLKFPWNHNMEEVLHMKPEDALAFIKTHFNQYEGKYTASL